MATCENLDDKKKIIEAKSLLRNSPHHSHVSIFHDKPKWQRQHEANIRLVVKTLGTNKLFVKGSRVCVSNDEQQWHHNTRPQRGARNEHVRGRDGQVRRGQGRGGHGNIGQGEGRGGHSQA